MNDVIKLLVLNRKTIFKLLVFINVVSIFVLFFVLHPIYRAETTLLPSNQDNSISSQMSGLASLVGINVGVSGLTDPALYPEILQSRRILEPIIMRKYRTDQFQDSVNLLTYFNIGIDSNENNWYEKSIQKAIHLFQSGVLEVDVDSKTSIVTIAINMPSDPSLAAYIANLIAESLGYYNREVRNNQAREQLSFIEKRLDEVSLDLEKSENRLKEFREKNRSIDFSPQLQLELSRLTREVEINQLVYGELKKNYELIKLEVIKNTPVINILDYAYPPAKKDKPKRLILMILINLLSCCIIVGFFFLREKKNQNLLLLQQWLDNNYLSYFKKYL